MKSRPCLRRRGILVCSMALWVTGCGTLVPGPRYMVNVDDFSFTHDGGAVAYLEDRYRYYPLLLLYNEKHYLYLYDRESGRHRRIAQTDAFSVSPHNSLILYAPPWERHFRHSGSEPDFYLADYARGTRKEFFMPSGFAGDYLSYGFAHVAWEKEGTLTAYVVFRYCPGHHPTHWKKQGDDPIPWHTKLWRVRIDPARGGREVAEAREWQFEKLPRIPARAVHDAKYLSPDGTMELLFSKYNGYLTFNTSLEVRRVGDGGTERLVVENRIINLAQACKYALYYIAGMPCVGLQRLGIL
ncbi:MAG: hypothetical protein NTZ78_13370 [Candidatus Aureabacteria bacterium]|nr:hypothetical protein [Candidatus Auribacterota bacterium]